MEGGNKNKKTFPLEGGRLKGKGRTAGEVGPYAGIGAIL